MSWRPPRIIEAIISVSTLVLGSAGATVQEATNLIDLGPVAPGLGINNGGEVVLQNYIFSHGMLTAFPGDFTGSAINAGGEVAGTLDAEFGQGPAAGLYANGMVTTLPTPNPYANFIEGWAGLGINDSGQVLVVFYGELDIPYSLIESIIGTSSIVYSLCAASNPAQAQAINDSGVVTGASPSPSSGCGDGIDAFLFDSTTRKVTDLGPGWGYAINASGQVTGISNTYNSTCSQNGDCTSQAFLYSEGKLSLLPGTDKCTGYGINSSGQVVGTCAGTAFFYDGSKVTINLDTFILSSDPLKPYVSLRDARGINDSGLVIVNGIDSRDNTAHAYLMQMGSGLVGAAPPPGKSGGGVFDSLCLSFLIGMLALRRVRRTIHLPQQRHWKYGDGARVERAATPSRCASRISFLVSSRRCAAEMRSWAVASLSVKQRG
jgi:uncharacterized membrane protein